MQKTPQSPTANIVSQPGNEDTISLPIPFYASAAFCISLDGSVFYQSGTNNYSALLNPLPITNGPQPGEEFLAFSLNSLFVYLAVGNNAAAPAASSPAGLHVPGFSGSPPTVQPPGNIPVWSGVWPSGVSQTWTDSPLLPPGTAATPGNTGLAGVALQSALRNGCMAVGATLADLVSACFRG